MDAEAEAARVERRLEQLGVPGTARGEGVGAKQFFFLFFFITAYISISRAGQSNAEQSRAEQRRAEQGRATQRRAEVVLTRMHR